MGTRAHERQELAHIDDERAVVKPEFPRKMQENGNSYTASLPKTMAQFLNLDEVSAPFEPSLVKGTQPVVIDEPAIVLRAYDGGTDE